MARVRLISRPFSVRLSFRHSFLSLFFNVKGVRFVKCLGYGVGSSFSCISDGVECDFNDIYPVLYWSGFWCDNFECHVYTISDVRFRLCLEVLSKAYPGVRIPISPWDLIWVFICCFLSRRVDYYRLTSTWIRRLYSLTRNSPLRLLCLDESVLLERVGSSFQVKQLTHAFRDFIDILSNYFGLSLSVGSDVPYDLLYEFCSKCDLWEFRKILISECRWVGPKVADSIIMCCFRDTSFAPVDVHLSTFTRRFFGLKLSVPNARYCGEYECYRCPVRDVCLRGYLLLKLGKLFGWFQSLTYIFGRDYCRTANPRCNVCPLKEYCYHATQRRRGVV